MAPSEWQFNYHLELAGLALLAVIFPFVRKLLDFSYSRHSDSKERSYSVDFVKGLAMTGIVIIHVDSYFHFFHPHDGSIWTRVLANLSRFSVPVFIISAGMFISWKDEGKNYWQSKITGILVPYLILSVVGYFLKYPKTDGWMLDLSARLFWGKVFQPYYFVPLLFGFYILFALVLRRFSLSNPRTAGVLLGGSLLLNFFSNHFLSKKTDLLLKLENISFTNFIFFFCLGLLAKRTLTDKKRIQAVFRSQASRVFPLFFLILYTGYIVYQTFRWEHEISNHLLFYPMIGALMLYRLGFHLEEKESFLPKFIFRIFAYIGKNSLGVFLIHPILIHLMHSFDPHDMKGAFIGWWSAFLLNLAVPLFIWWGAGKIIGLFRKEK